MSSTGTLYLSFGELESTISDPNNGTNIGYQTVKIYRGKPDGVSPLVAEDTGRGDSIVTIAANNNVLTGGTFTAIAVTAGGDILKSTRNGDAAGTWTAVANFPNGGLLGLTYANGVWVIVGSNNQVYTSTNATTWTKRKGALPGAEWAKVVYGAGKFVAVGGAFHTKADGSTESKGIIQYSTDNGATWTLGNAGTKNVLTSIAYSPTLNKFVAVGYNGAIVSVNG